MKLILKILLVVLMLSLPILLITSAIRVALIPVFVTLEYNLPGFPADDYGFSTSDRLIWSRFSIDYLLGRTSHEELTSQTLPDGSPLFNERELSHMLDVRNLTKIVIRIWLALLAFFMLVSFLSWQLKAQNAWRLALQRGGRLTIALIAGILVFVALNFNELFTRFHLLFFEGDSWLFLMSDNLIRLFPIRFWQDIFIFIGSLSIILAFSLTFLVKTPLGKDEPSNPTK